MFTYSFDDINCNLSQKITFLIIKCLNIFTLYDYSKKMQNALVNQYGAYQYLIRKLLRRTS